MSKMLVKNDLNVYNLIILLYSFKSKIYLKMQIKQVRNYNDD